MIEEKAPIGTVSSARLKDGTGATLDAFLPDAPLTVEVDWSMREKATVRFAMDLISADGRLVFSTTWFPGELSGSGTAKLELKRLGLGGGAYDLYISAAGNGEPVTNMFRLPLHVAPTDGVGLLRPEHRWTL